MTHGNRSRSKVTRRPEAVSRLSVVAGVVVTAMLVASSTGCGSSGKSLSAAQAQAVSQELFTALQSAVGQAIPAAEPRGPRPSLASTFDALAMDQSGCVSSQDGETCNIPVSYSGPCPGGGTIGISGDFDFTLNTSGDGSDSTTFTVTPTNCAVSNLTINGNPSVTAATQINFANDAPVFPITLSETGGITYGPNPSGSCTLNVQYSVLSASSCTVAGTVCGQSVSGSC